MAILLPLGILSAWLYAPNPVPVKLLDKEQVDLLPVKVQLKETNSYTAILHSNKEKNLWQLEWRNKMPLTVPSAVIYHKFQNSEVQKVSPVEGDLEWVLVGRIEAKGDYVFDIKTDSSNNSKFNFVLYDFIHEKVIDSLNF